METPAAYISSVGEISSTWSCYINMQRNWDEGNKTTGYLAMKIMNNKSVPNFKIVILTAVTKFLLPSTKVS
jgi:hypothetical protein